MILMDNGSTDDTVQRACARDRVTVIRCQLPFANFKQHMRRFLVSRFARHGWCIVLDIDERFHYPEQSRLSIEDFVAYLDANHYTAAMGHLLDLFPDGESTSWPVAGKDLEAQSCWYDLSDVRRKRFRLPGCKVPRDGIGGKYIGGIRLSAFGTDVDLTKVPIINSGRGVLPSLESSHRCCDAVLADVDTLLAHYKFNRDFLADSEEAVRRRSHWRESEQYQAYCRELHRNPKLKLRGPTARRFLGVDEMVQNGFLSTSPAFADWVARRSGATVGASRFGPKSDDRKHADAVSAALLERLGAH